MGPGFCPEFGCRALPAQSIWQGSGFAADQTNAMLAVVRADDESLVPPQAAELALSVARPLPTETALLGFGGSPVGEVIKLPFCIFSALLCGGDITTLWPLWLCRNNPARGLFQQKKRLSQSGCSAPMDACCSLLHTVLFWHLYAWGGITTLGVRFMLLKRWTPAGHGGVFAVFMPPQNSPCAG